MEAGIQSFPRQFDPAIERDSEGYPITCRTQPRSLDEVTERIREAIALCLELQSVPEQNWSDSAGDPGGVVPSSASVGEVIRKLHPVLNGWCIFFRVGNSNRAFDRIDWAV